MASAAAVLAAALVSAPALAGPAVDYSNPAHWLCRPGRADVCSTPLTSTVVAPADGSLTRKTYAPDPAAPIDCFYVYPTVSREPTANADLTASPEVQHAAAEQFARFSAVCRPYAPLYRQTTVAALDGRAQGADRAMAYGDVLAAWRYYLAHDNHGRGVVLIGHSQGSRHLDQLLAEEIDGKPAQRLLVSAIVPGMDLQVPNGADVGASLHHIRLCHSADQTGCVIAYSSFLAALPPGADAYFGRSDAPGTHYACVNPGALIDDGALDSELPTVGKVAETLGTPLVENPGLISAVCATVGQETFLAVSIKPTGAGAMTLNRVLTDAASRAPGWGLHNIDVNLTLGDLIQIVGRQAKAWQAPH
jgi:hypothetical protein